MKGSNILAGLTVVVLIIMFGYSKAQQPTKKTSAKPVSHSIIAEPKVRTVAGSPIVSLDPVEIDLRSLYWTEEELSVLQEQDELYKMYEYENYLQELGTSVGLFRVVSCYGRRSIDPKAKHGEGSMFDMVQLPNGRWIAGQPLAFSIRSVLERNGKVFLVSDRAVYQWVGDEKLRRILLFKDTGKWLPCICTGDAGNGMIFDRYFQVCEITDTSNFRGLLECVNDQWKFYPYEGKNCYWVEYVEQYNKKLAFTMKGYKNRIEFDPANGSYAVYEVACEQITHSFMDE